ncbi:MAG: DUF4383 domain-containing protein [Patescibacteria group bacterium]|nr:DUF4383 domain-containing protein [Patescibacteria group bacterium]MDE1966196.1 DUF4383 domain-containing protein [Patescibacteria group bacterium]
MAKTLAIIAGIVVIVVGLLGFFANPLVGAGALFVTNTALDVLYIIIGIILLVVAFMATQQSALWLKIMGVVYLVLMVLGFLMGTPVLGFLEVNAATNWLHLILGIVLVAAGYYGHSEPGMAPSGMGGMPPSGSHPM